MAAPQNHILKIIIQLEIVHFASSFLKMSKSSSNLNEIVYSGRPKNEEPHVKKSVKKKSERIEYIVRVDLVRKSLIIWGIMVL